jgi:cell division protein FtsN
MAKQGRVGLGLWDRLVLLVAWVVTCGLVYVLGFYVGKGTQEQRLGLEERIVRLPVTSRPPPEGKRPQAEDKLTFYDTLASGESGDGRLAREGEGRDSERPAPTTTGTTAPARAATPTPAAPPAIVPPRPTASGPAAAPVLTPSPATAPRPPAAPAPPPRLVASPPASTPPETSPVAPPAPVDGAVAAAVPPRPAPPRVGGTWTVQANPTRSRDEAEALYRRLRGHGYDASLVRVPRDGDTWYRVQVGRFATSGQATETMQRLREREGVSHVFVASE